MNQQVMLFVNLANFTGMLNNIFEADGHKVRVRVDYKELREALTFDRHVLDAYCISQQDPRRAQTSASHEMFLNRLPDFGWSPVQVIYDYDTSDISAVENAIKERALAPFRNERGSLDYAAIRTTDLMFITGSGQWYNVINELRQYGFNIQIAFSSSSRSGKYAEFDFCDLTEFLHHSKQEAK